MAKRVSLREYQQSLVTRLRAVTDAPAAPISLLGLQVGRDNWLVELSDAGEVLPLPSFIPVPLTRSWYCGVANVRGNLHSIVDLAAFIGDTPTQPTVDSRVLLVGQKFGVNCGILVSRMLGLRKPGQLTRKERTSIDRPWVKGQYLDDDGALWTELAMRELVQHPDFLQVGL
ncbi:MAG: chemotaxis protein CheW [Burkholderiales bacterium]|nr:chemotaxis protein CheW [Burkholderiales bacterium]